MVNLILTTKLSEKITAHRDAAIARRMSDLKLDQLYTRLAALQTEIANQNIKHDDLRAAFQQTRVALRTELAEAASDVSSPDKQLQVMKEIDAQASEFTDKLLAI